MEQDSVGEVPTSVSCIYLTSVEVADPYNSQDELWDLTPESTLLPCSLLPFRDMRVFLGS